MPEGKALTFDQGSNEIWLGCEIDDGRFIAVGWRLRLRYAISHATFTRNLKQPVPG